MSRWVNLKPPEPPVGQLNHCIRCGDLVNVHAIGLPFDPATFAGGCCLVPMNTQAEVEPVPYDPATAPIPY